MESGSTIQANTTYTVIVPSHQEAARIDRFLPTHFAGYSRSFFQKLVAQECIKVNNTLVVKPSFEIRARDVIEVFIPALQPQELAQERRIRLEQANFAIRIKYVHEHFIIIAKPANVLVHKPSAQSNALTLVDWLVHNFQELNNVGAIDRPGIVHRLDKETSGLMIVPRTPYAHAAFTAMFKERKIHKTYLALVSGHPEKSGSISYNIDRHPTDKTKMSWFYHTGRSALTHYTVQEYFDQAALVEAKPVTGRTHQIRVHFAALQHSLLGDGRYGTKSPYIKRHALHAYRLAFVFENSYFEFTEEIPADFAAAIAALRTKSA